MRSKPDKEFSHIKFTSNKDNIWGYADMHPAEQARALAEAKGEKPVLTVVSTAELIEKLKDLVRDLSERLSKAEAELAACDVRIQLLENRVHGEVRLGPRLSL